MPLGKRFSACTNGRGPEFPSPVPLGMTDPRGLFARLSATLPVDVGCPPRRGVEAARPGDMGARPPGLGELGRASRWMTRSLGFSACGHMASTYC
jgi:hypothetical protein